MNTAESPRTAGNVKGDIIRVLHHVYHAILGKGFGGIPVAPILGQGFDGIEVGRSPAFLKPYPTFLPTYLGPCITSLYLPIVPSVSLTCRIGELPDNRRCAPRDHGHILSFRCVERRGSLPDLFGHGRITVGAHID
jgi:hypothetical protein